MKFFIKKIILIFTIHFCQQCLTAQTPNQILLPPQDECSLDIKTNEVYWLDTLEYSNGAKVYYTYDALGNRTTEVENPAAPKPELRVLDAMIPDTLGLGITMVFDADWRNSGPSTVSGFTLGNYISQDSLWDIGDTFGINTPYPIASGVFPAQVTETIPTSILVPSNITPEQYYYLILYIDNDTIIDEYSEINNFWIKKVWITSCPLIPNLQEVVTPAVCNGSNGDININLPNGFDITWENGTSNPNLENVVEGYWTYSLTYEGNLCTYQDSILIEGLSALEGITSKSNTTCNNSNGTASININTGVAPYTYQWNTGNTGTDVSGLAIGTYDVTVVDANGCQNVFGYNIDAEPLPDVVINGTDATCAIANGSASANVSLGVGNNFSYLWSNGETTSSIENLDAGIYAVTVTDEAGCTAIDQIILESGIGVGANINQSGNVLEAIPISGTAPFVYMWNTGQTSNVITATISGTYTIGITDANGCVGEYSIDVEVIPTSIQDLNEVHNFYVYPNPNDGKGIMLHTTMENIRQIYIYDTSGRKVGMQRLTPPVGEEVSITTNLSSGTYILSAKDERGKQIAATQFIVR